MLRGPRNGIGSGVYTDTEHCERRARLCLELCGDRRRTAIDGGAFIGSFSQHLVRSFACVMAFEPVPDNFAFLVQNLPAVYARQVALSSSCSTAMMRPLPGKEKKAFAWSIGKDGALQVQTITVDLLQLDDLDLLKLDVEGHELAALRGARQTLERCRPVVMIEEKLDPGKKATSYLQDLGMKCVDRIKHDLFFIWE